MAEKVTISQTQYLTFRLGAEFFALEISRVREVLDYTPITKVPRMPAFLSGVINVRGNVVPVMDLKLQLGMGVIERTVDTCIVIVEVQIDDELVMMGALADSVQEVIDLEVADIEPPPKLGTRLNTDFIKGMGKHDENFIIILDIDKVLSTDQLVELQKTGKREAVPTA